MIFLTILENLLVYYKIPKIIYICVPTIRSIKKVKKQSKNLSKGTPSSSSYITKVFDDYIELGYKNKKDSVITGLGKIASQPAVIIAQNYNLSLIHISEPTRPY